MGRGEGGKRGRGERGEGGKRGSGGGGSGGRGEEEGGEEDGEGGRGGRQEEEGEGGRRAGRKGAASHTGARTPTPHLQIPPSCCACFSSLAVCCMPIHFPHISPNTTPTAHKDSPPALL